MLIVVVLTAVLVQSVLFNSVQTGPELETVDTVGFLVSANLLERLRC